MSVDMRMNEMRCKGDAIKNVYRYQNQYNFLGL